MPRFERRALLILLCIAGAANAQTALTWEQVRERFRANNPNLMAARLSIDEAKASEVTAYLRPNPDSTVSIDQIDPFTVNPYRPFGNTLPFLSFSYLHERNHQRELRRDSARKATGIAELSLADQERTLLFNLKNAFVQLLQAKAVVALAKENLTYYDNVLKLSSIRLQAGDIAQIDLDRLELQRVQFESDLQTAETNLRTAKIQLLTLMNDRTPVERFDATGQFDFTDSVMPLEEFRKIALDTRPDLKSALQSVDKAKTDHQLAIANGSTDPTFGMDFARNPPISAYFGVSVSIPLRIFDRNQGEKLRTELDVARNEKLRQANEAQVFSDVDSAYTTLNGTLALLRVYKARYLQQALRVRDTVSFAYQRGGASLLDFLSAQNDYRSIQLNYLNLVGSYMNSASQLNLATGKEVIQ